MSDDRSAVSGDRSVKSDDRSVRSGDRSAVSDGRSVESGDRSDLEKPLPPTSWPIPPERAAGTVDGLRQRPKGVRRFQRIHDPGRPGARVPWTSPGFVDSLVMLP